MRVGESGSGVERGGKGGIRRERVEREWVRVGESGSGVERGGKGGYKKGEDGERMGEGGGEWNWGREGGGGYKKGEGGEREKEGEISEPTAISIEHVHIPN